MLKFTYFVFVGLDYLINKSTIRCQRSILLWREALTTRWWRRRFGLQTCKTHQWTKVRFFKNQIWSNYVEVSYNENIMANIWMNISGNYKNKKLDTTGRGDLKVAFESIKAYHEAHNHGRKYGECNISFPNCISNWTKIFYTYYKINFKAHKGNWLI